MSSLWAFGGVTCGRGGKGGQRAVTRALGLTWIPGATTAALRSGSRAKGVTGGVGLDVTSWGFELEIKIKRRRPLRTIEGGLQAPRRQGLLLGFTPLGGARDWLRARVRVGVVAITLVSWHRSSNPKLQWHARFGNMDANAAFTPSSLPFTGAGGGLKPVQYDAARACATRLRPATRGWPREATGI